MRWRRRSSTSRWKSTSSPFVNLRTASPRASSPAGTGGVRGGRAGATVAPVQDASTAAISPELRIDPLTGLRSIIAGSRAGRPGGDLSAPPAPTIDPDSDPFAEGHEDRTPPEVYAVRPNGGGPNTPGWSVRVVPNLYPALNPVED